MSILDQDAEDNPPSPLAVAFVRSDDEYEVNMSTVGSSQSVFRGWENYPVELTTATEEQFAYDLRQYNESLRRESEHIFVPKDGDTYLQVTELGAPRGLTIGMRR